MPQANCTLPQKTLAPSRLLIPFLPHLNCNPLEEKLTVSDAIALSLAHFVCFSRGGLCWWNFTSLTMEIIISNCNISLYTPCMSNTIYLFLRWFTEALLQRRFGQTHNLQSLSKEMKRFPSLQKIQTILSTNTWKRRKKQQFLSPSEPPLIIWRGDRSLYI